MARVLYEDMLDSTSGGQVAIEAKTSVDTGTSFATDEWNTTMEDFSDDFDDYQDLSFPSMDDDY